jgi:hypothetical protein
MKLPNIFGHALFSDLLGDAPIVIECGARHGRVSACLSDMRAGTIFDLVSDAGLEANSSPRGNAEVSGWLCPELVGGSSPAKHVDAQFAAASVPNEMRAAAQAKPGEGPIGRCAPVCGLHSSPKFYHVPREKPWLWASACIAAQGWRSDGAIPLQGEGAC